MDGRVKCICWSQYRGACLRPGPVDGRVKCVCWSQYRGHV